MKPHLKYLIFSVLVLTSYASAASDNPDLLTREQYDNQKHQLAYKDQLDFAVSTLAEPAEDGAYDEALNDIERITKVQKNAESVLPAVEAFLDGAEPGSASFEKAWLVRARLLCRAGNVEEGSRLFKEGMLERGWSNAFPFYIDTLEELGQYARAVAEQFNLACDPRVVDHEGRNFLDFFLQKLIAMTAKDVDSSAVRDVYPCLKRDKEHPEYADIGEALCLVADSRYEEGISILEELDASFGIDWGTTLRPDDVISSEHRNIAAYLSAALFLEQARLQSLQKESDYQKARSYLAEFVSRNPDRPVYVLKVALRIVRCLEELFHGATHSSFFEVTSYLVNAGFADDPKIRDRLEDWLVAHFLDLHQLGLGQDFRFEEQKQMCQRIVAEFDLKHPGSINAAYSLARILLFEEKRPEQAEQILLRIVSETSYPIWKRAAQKDLVHIRTERGDPPEKILPFVEDLRESASTEGQRMMWDWRASQLRDDS